MLQIDLNNVLVQVYSNIFTTIALLIWQRYISLQDHLLKDNECRESNIYNYEMLTLRFLLFYIFCLFVFHCFIFFFFFLQFCSFASILYSIYFPQRNHNENIVVGKFCVISLPFYFMQGTTYLLYLLFLYCPLFNLL